MHHLTRWADGGTTDIDTQIMICPPHHARAHDQRYNLTKLPPANTASTDARRVADRYDVCPLPPTTRRRHGRRR